MNGSDEGLQQIQRSIQPMLQLIVLIANSQPPAPESLYASACALAGDLLHAFGVQFLPVVDTAEFGIAALVNKCKRSRQNKAKSIATWVSDEEIFKKMVSKLIFWHQVSRELARVRRQAAGQS